MLDPTAVRRGRRKAAMRLDPETGRPLVRWDRRLIWLLNRALPVLRWGHRPRCASVKAWTIGFSREGRLRRAVQVATDTRYGDPPSFVEAHDHPLGHRIGLHVFRALPEIGQFEQFLGDCDVRGVEHWFGRNLHDRGIVSFDRWEEMARTQPAVCVLGGRSSATTPKPEKVNFH